ncbi:hypothetical protein B4N89_47350 [Embleya scabrispora]|uniref:Type II toxin-antitoxin system RelE/ParE family toxin n=1 Tax=Embleya scabrispora TaxID=159449 RepID=A0A1T3NI27_9ACTN|nr:hypothetical protein [Embleya scabrispora]OPC76428.1 hypothetical protein B4N89_47350 [Embleya scabrispora]
MARYRVQFTDSAENNIAKLPATRQRQIKSAADSALGSDPYGNGSSSVRGNRDRRDVTLANAILTYEVSPNVVVVTVVQVVAPFG